MLVDSPAQFASKRYDYVIIGGGTAGLLSLRNPIRIFSNQL
jgi:hypothetical protein